MRIPVYEIQEWKGEVAICDFCSDEFLDIEEEVHVDDDGSTYCDQCLDIVVANLYEVYAEEASRVCKVTHAFPEFDYLNTFAPTPEEYEAGDRVANTENSYRCAMRHEYTNYDELIKNLSQGVLADAVRYHAIRDRIEEIIENEISEKDLGLSPSWNDSILRPSF